MGTRGLFVLRYKRYYYIKFNPYDSYPSGLGRELVNAIPISPKQFDIWIEKKRQLCEKMAAYKEYDGFERSDSRPEKDPFIEWTYTYDLDNLLFVVDSKAPFSLRNIARERRGEWIQYIAVDARGHRCLSLDTPPHLVGLFGYTDKVFLGADPLPSVDDFDPAAIISDSTWSKPLTPHHRRLMLSQVHATIAETYSDLFVFPDWDVKNQKIQGFAMSFLEAIVPNNQAIVMNRQSPTLQADYSDITAPRDGGPWFWYRGCLILLAPDFDRDEYLKVYVQAVVARAKAKNRDRCTALLWSIRHVAVVEISGDTVSHSRPIPFLAAYGYDEDGFMNALHLLWHYLPYPRWRIVEDSRISHLGKLPTEILMRIMMFTDQLVYPNYQFVSREFFKLWWKQLRVASYTIIPDADEVDETSRRFKAYSAGPNALMEVEVEALWGKQTGNIWGMDLEPSDDPNSAPFYRRQMGAVDDAEQSSKGPAKYRLQRFCSYWPEDLSYLPRISDIFSGHPNALNVQPI